MRVLLFLSLFVFIHISGTAQEQFRQFTIYELGFEGSTYSPADNPVRDVKLETRWVHQEGKASVNLYGFWYGDGKAGGDGNIFKVRFCPIFPGNWKLEMVKSNDPKLMGQQEGLILNCLTSDHPGFWEVKQYDMENKSTNVLGKSASGIFTFDLPDSRALFVVLKTNKYFSDNRNND